MAEQLASTWLTEDLPVLVAAVEILDETGRADGPEVAARVQREPKSVVRSLLRLRGEYLAMHVVVPSWGEGLPPIGFVYINGVTGAARRAVGQWPTAEELSTEVLAELERVAKATPGEKGKALQGLISATVEPGANFLGTTLGAVFKTILNLP